jgi:hypothetical protein
LAEIMPYNHSQYEIMILPLKKTQAAAAYQQLLKALSGQPP